MAVIQIVKKEFIQNIRDLNVMLIMTLFPVILMFLVGSAFESSENTDIYGINTARVDIFTEESPEVIELVDNIVEKLGQYLDGGDQIKLVTNYEESMNRLQNNDIDMMIEVDGSEVILYKNETYYRQFAVLSTVLSEKIKVDKKSIDMNLLKMNKVENTYHQSLLDYYGIAFLILFVVYGISNAITYTIKEKKEGNTSRILLSPIKPIEVILGKVLGHTGVNMIQVGIVFMTTVFVFDVNWGPKPLVMAPLFLSSVLMIVSLGIMFGMIFKSEAVSLSIIHTLIVAFAFFGGSYMSLKGLGFLGQVGKFFSPIWWMTTGSIEYIYLDQSRTLLLAILINMITCFLCCGISCLVIKKKEVLM